MVNRPIQRRIADVGRTAVVAVLGAFSLNRPVDHPEFDRTWIQPPNISNTPRNLHMPTTHTFRKRHMAR
jgi:hypothetical protein